MSAVLRVHGRDLDLTRVLTSIPAHKIDTSWRTGEARLLGRVHTTSGATVVLSASEDRQSIVAEASAAFLEVAPQITELVRQGASAEVDFALPVSAVESRSLAFEPAMLRALADANVGLTVSAYPVCDDGDESDSEA